MTDVVGFFFVNKSNLKYTILLKIPRISKTP